MIRIDTRNFIVRAGLLEQYILNSMASRRTILFEGHSDFSDYQIIDMLYEGREARVLYGDNATPQSGVALDDDPELLFDYNQRFLEIIESIRPRSILVIGGGVFMLPMAVLDRLGDMVMDVIEIDPLLPQLARDYFDFVDDPRLNVIIGDGRAYVDSCTKTYDLIIVDAFTAYDIPRSLLSLEAVQAYARCLNEDGVVAVNFIAAYRTHRTTLAHQLQATFETAFADTELYPADPTYDTRSEQNLVLVASQKEIPPLYYLQSAPVQLLFTPENVVLHDEV